MWRAFILSLFQMDIFLKGYIWQCCLIGLSVLHPWRLLRQILNLWDSYIGMVCPTGRKSGQAPEKCSACLSSVWECKNLGILGLTSLTLVISIFLKCNSNNCCAGNVRPIPTPMTLKSPWGTLWWKINIVPKIFVGFFQKRTKNIILLWS